MTIKMTTEETDNLIRSWIILHQAKHESDEYQANFWAFDKLIKLIFDDPESGAECFIKILKSDASDLIIENLAAGPIEDFLSFHGTEGVRILEAKLPESPELANALGGVWQGGISEDVWNEFEKIRSNRIW